jgi:GNAT superfamily N-acetyltransferase
MYQYRSLNGVSLQQLSDCFNLAFSDYEQSIHFTVESLNYYLTASAVDLSLSFGAFCNGQMVGFILNAKGIYENKNVVFDAGTGIVPDHRGKKVFSSLFQYTCQQLQLQGITKYYLEVLQSNHNAVDIYSKKGFQIRRSYSVLTASGPKYTRNENVTAILYSDFKGFTTTTSVAPSFEHTSHAIDGNPQLYEVLFLSDLAYCIYAKRNGEIIQLHYNDLAALKDVLAALTHQYPSAMAKNIDCNCSDIIEMLKEIGFKEILKQYEMVKDI